jgi:hypothetical protein
MKKAYLILLANIFAFALSAQVVDFSGNWSLDPAKSKLSEQFSMAPAKILISQSSAEINMEKHSDFQGQEMVTNDKLSLDGKECINKGFMDSEKKSTVSWDSTSQSLTIISKVVMNDGGEINIKEVYSITEKALVIVSNVSSPFGDMVETMVYNKI